jgi:hypothetical protein
VYCSDDSCVRSTAWFDAMVRTWPLQKMLGSGGRISCKSVFTDFAAPSQDTAARLPTAH